jgi:hypothetical protein
MQASPGYAERLAAARHGRAAGIALAEQVIPGSARPCSGLAAGILGFYLDADAQLIRIFDIVWIG